MLNEYRDIMSVIKTKNEHFAKIFEKQKDLDDKISEVEAGREHMEQTDLEILKKEKLKLKDEAYAMILEHKKENV